MKTTLNEILNRLKQESTWRGLIVVATLVGAKLQPEQIEAIVTAGVSLIAAINILKKD
jgi:hypothetical protein